MKVPILALALAAVAQLQPQPGTQSVYSDDLSPSERINVYVYETCNRSVVNITTRIVTEGFFGVYGETEGMGSGIVLDKQGHILTNYHVIADAHDVVVTLYDSSEYRAKFVGADPNSDTALLRIDAPPEKLFPIRLGDSSKLRVGLEVFAIGNPFGLGRTMTKGIISSLNRTVRSPNDRLIKGVIQTDAAVNPGNSGGPLLDKHGRMIGMTMAIKARVGQSSGIAFAIPVNTIKRVVPQLIRYGRVIRGDLGILEAYPTGQGLLVWQLQPGGAAERAGIRGPAVYRRGPYLVIDRSAADVIVAIDDQPVRTFEELISYAENKKPGDIVVLTVIRDGQRIKIPVRLQEAPR